ncbi:serine hydrolase domain-containing protein [Candidatus Nitrosocosmicus agrestis]|uniref:serine hydrolase domain-containing protein n=1 Tax=Candidatus Nitrosocosmicus agrestis TaxID=2563600 RepID=UPI00122E86B7|nr:serine hydrolase domain-containing protein [Candidatus Nitrosocosmicus sp. SS]KAA2283500.1 beta-lactamase family protein [Candidatus Nitrosocosmicus sp. SS]KAF0869582.1 beta-lactamase family protein [Candidatus Nitrosocosmicus sp. SS]
MTLMENIYLTLTIAINKYQITRPESYLIFKMRNDSFRPNILIMIISILLFANSFSVAMAKSISNETNGSKLLDVSKTDTIKVTNVDDKLEPAIKEFIINKVLNKSKSSMVIGFIDPNGTKVYSFGNISDTNNAPVDGNTIYDIDSLTKTFTTLALANMVKDGIVNLDDPIEKFLPTNVSAPQFNGFDITLADLATHTSGLPYMPSNIWVNETAGEINSAYSISDLYEGLSNTTLLSKPGTKFLYSDFGMGLLGQILIHIEGEGTTYEQLVKNRILNVLGMNDTKISLSEDELLNRLPDGHLNGSTVLTPKIPDSIAAAGAFHSTTNDMLKYLAANMGLLHTSLDDSIHLQHLIRHSVQMQNPLNYYEYVALGWGILSNLSIELLNHQGSFLGWNSFIGFIPSEQKGIVILCSCDKSDVNTKSLGIVLLGLSEPSLLTSPKNK